MAMMPAPGDYVVEERLPLFLGKSAHQEKAADSAEQAYDHGTLLC
jgi:hypothetical protein